MKNYLVGGAVRDKLLGRDVKDRDYVVIGATQEQMLNAGFTQVGKDFPVFLHPETKEEYALARTERKQGIGYHGFQVYFGEDVSLEDDLLRRDLTINAIAEDDQGKHIDPYNGLQDLDDKILRHVSLAFAEDPLRVLRVARFAARYAYLGFSIAQETLELMQQISLSGELSSLTPERVWQETVSALAEDNAEVFFQVLQECHALKVIYPEVDALFGVPQPIEHHPEIDSGKHTMLCLQQACLEGASTPIRFAVLTHDLGKALTPKEELPSHRGHEKTGLKPLKQLCERLKVPKSYQKIAHYVCENHLKSHRIFEMSAKKIVKLIGQLDGYRNPQNIIDFTIACRCDARGRTGFENKPYPQAEFLQACLHATKSIRFVDIIPERRQLLQEKGRGDLIAEEIYKMRISAVKHLMK